MSDLVTFLRARLDEDERELTRDPPRGLGYANLGARVLREVEAGRAILAEHHPTDWTAYGDHMCSRCVLDDDEPHPDDHHWLPYPCPTVRYLAAVYNTHPDYDQAWKP